MTTNEPNERHAESGPAESGRAEPGRAPAQGLDPADTELFESFSALRLADAAVVPDFDSMLARPRRIRRGLLRLGLPLAAAAALVLVVIWPGQDAEFRRTVLAYTTSPALGAWSSPTDFLLHTPGRDLLMATPDIGRTAGWPATPDAHRASTDSTHGG